MQENKISEDRIIMLSDGIFAIAITLLVLDVRIPDGLTAQNFNTMVINSFLPKATFYIITFVIIARYWLAHRNLTNATEHLDNIFLLLNLLFLAFIAFIPAVTNIIEEYNKTLAVILYTAVLVGCGYSITLLWAYALKNPLTIAQDIRGRSIDRRIFNSAFIPTFFLCSLLLLFIPNFDPTHVFFSWLTIPIILFVGKRIYLKVATKQEKKEQASIE